MSSAPSSTPRSAAGDVVVQLPDEAATGTLGELLGRHLRAGEALALVGELGAGKTCLARGVARGLGVEDLDAVTSPTYLLVVEHPGPRPMVHVDAYLPQKTRAFLADGGLDYLQDQAAVLVVEWADRLPEMLPERTLWLFLGPRGQTPSGEQKEGRQAILREAREGPSSWQQFPWVNQLPEIAQGP